MQGLPSLARYINDEGGSCSVSEVLEEVKILCDLFLETEIMH
jgi:hypothetical protein